MKPTTLSQAEIDALFAAASDDEAPTADPPPPSVHAQPAAAQPDAAPLFPAPPIAAQPLPAQPFPTQPVLAEPAPAEPQTALFPNLESRAPGVSQEQVPLGLLANVEMEVTVLLGQVRRSIRDILNMGPGAVVELDKIAGEAVDVLVNNRRVAKGEIVVIGENFGVRITELVTNTGATGV